MCKPLAAQDNGNIVQCFRTTKMHLLETGWGGCALDSTGSQRWVIVKMAMNFWIP
jgi:hypothetical protein